MHIRQRLTELLATSLLTNTANTALACLVVLSVIAQSPPAEAAPAWQRVSDADANRNQYRQYLPDQLKSRMDTPIQQRGYLDFIERRAAEFRVGRVAMPLKLMKDSVIDAGSTVPNYGTTIALVDLPGSPAINQMLGQRYRINLNLNIVTAKFVTTSSYDHRESRAQGSPVYAVRHKVNVTVAARNGSRVRQYESGPNGWTVVIDVQQGQVTPLSAQQASTRLSVDKPVYLGGYARVNVQRGPTPRGFFSEIAPQQLAQLCRSGRCGQPARLTRDLASGQVIPKRPPSLPGSANVPAPVAESVAVVQGTVLPPQPDPVTGQSIALWGNPLSLLNLTCNNFCNVGDCAQCCLNEAADRALVIQAATLGCVLAAGPCIGCQLACAIYSVEVQAVSAATLIGCTGGCLVPNVTSIAAAPQQCGTVAQAGRSDSAPPPMNLESGRACIGPQQCASGICDAVSRRCVPRDNSGAIGEYCNNPRQCGLAPGTNTRLVCRPPAPGADFTCQRP